MSADNAPSVALGQDYPLTEIPDGARKGFWSNAVVLLGFTFFTATMWGGGKLGVGMKFWPDLVGVILVGNLLLGLYVAVLGLAAYRTGLNTVLMARFCFGEWGSKGSDLLLGLTQVGWYGWGTATVAIMLVKMLHLPPQFDIPLMLAFGFLFCWTAYIGYRGLEVLSIVAVPVMTALLMWSMARATRDVGGWQNLLAIQPREALSVSAGITIVFGTFASGGTQATNWTRFARSAWGAGLASLAAFFVGNGLMIFSGAYTALIYNQADIVEVLALQGLMGWGVVMLLLNIWTTQDNTIYNFSVAGCNLCRTSRRQAFTLGGAAIGTIIAILGIYDNLVPYLLVLGTLIPPLGGIIMADFWIVNRGRYPRLQAVAMPRVNWAGVITYGLAVLISVAAPGVPPVNGILSGLILYPLLMHGLARLGHAQGFRIR